VAEHGGDALVDRREALGQVGQAEQLGHAGGVERGRPVAGVAGEGGDSIGRCGRSRAHRFSSRASRRRGRAVSERFERMLNSVGASRCRSRDLRHHRRAAVPLAPRRAVVRKLSASGCRGAPA
jgi:hypothetical protein